MTKAELINEISLATGYDKTTVSLIVESFMSGIKNSVSSGEDVFIRGFGSFIAKTRKAKIARNISANTSVRVPEHKIAAFRPAAEFADAVRNLK